MKPLNLQPSSTQIVSPERFLEIFANEPDNIAYAEVIPGRLGDVRLGGLIILKRKKHVYQYPSLAGDKNGTTVPANRSAIRANVLGEIGRIIKRLAGSSRPATA